MKLPLTNQTKMKNLRASLRKTIIEMEEEKTMGLTGHTWKENEQEIGRLDELIDYYSGIIRELELHIK